MSNRIAKFYFQCQGFIDEQNFRNLGQKHCPIISNQGRGDVNHFMIKLLLAKASFLRLKKSLFQFLNRNKIGLSQPSTRELSDCLQESTP